MLSLDYSPKSGAPSQGPRSSGGRTWWAHFEFTRINITPTILRKKIEDFLNIAVFSLLVEEFELRRSPVGLPRSLDVAAELAELPESLMTRIEQQGRRHRDHRRTLAAKAATKGSLFERCRRHLRRHELQRSPSHAFGGTGLGSRFTTGHLSRGAPVRAAIRDAGNGNPRRVAGFHRTGHRLGLSGCALPGWITALSEHVYRTGPDRARRGHRFHGAHRRRESVHSRTPVLLVFSVRLPSVEAKGRWRERGRMGRNGQAEVNRAR